jgi:hypothetical protein
VLKHWKSYKKDGTVRFIGNYREQNKRIVRNTPFPFPKISTVLQELEGFTSLAMALELNMGYYTISCTQTRPRFARSFFSVGQILLPTVTNGRSNFPRHFPSLNVTANGNP